MNSLCFAGKHLTAVSSSTFPTTHLLFPRTALWLRADAVGDRDAQPEPGWQDKWPPAETVVEQGFGSQRCELGTFPKCRWAACPSCCFETKACLLSRGNVPQICM